MNNELVKKETKTFVEITTVNFDTDGSFVPRVKEVCDRSPIPQSRGMYSYRFFDRTYVTTSDGEILKGDRRNYSGIYYIGELVSLRDVISDIGSKDPFIEYYQSLQEEGIVKLVHTTYLVLGKGDQAIASDFSEK